MNFANDLTNYINASGKTLDTIARDCEELGVKIHPTYISKLKLGHREPPDYQVTVALAKSLGVEPEKLLASSLQTQSEIKNQDLMKALEFAYPNKSKSDLLVKAFNIEKSRSDIILKELGINYDYNSEPPEFEAITPPTLTVPIIGTIPAGKPALAVEHIEEWTEIPNMWNLKDGEVFVLNVKGDSMINSRIYEGDRVIVKIQQDVENGEIAVVNVNGEDATLKRVKKINGQVILYPDNPNYEPIFITNENARIIGKVIQVMFDPHKRF